MLSEETATRKLCLSCGLCCNGVIFRDVKLRARDDVAVLQSYGLPILGQGSGRLAQPCAALDGCRCRVYANRPMYCQQFECGLFKGVVAGHVKLAAALRLVRNARRRVQQVGRLLRGLGDQDDQSPLKARFDRVVEQASHGLPDKKTAGRFGRLTLAMHELNLLLSDWFYPGRREGEGAKSRVRRIAGTRQER